MEKMEKLFVSRSEYEAIKKGKDILIVVEAKGESAMYACVRAYTTNSSSDRHSGYENAIFNGEVD